MYLTAKFDRYTFNRSEVIVRTNKQTDAAENIHLAPLCYAGGWVNIQWTESGLGTQVCSTKWHLMENDRSR